MTGGLLYLSILQRKYPWVLCGAQLVIVVHYSSIWLLSKPLDTLTLWICSKEVHNLWTLCHNVFHFLLVILYLIL